MRSNRMSPQKSCRQPPEWGSVINVNFSLGAEVHWGLTAGEATIRFRMVLGWAHEESGGRARALQFSGEGEPWAVAEEVEEKEGDVHGDR